MGFRKILIDLDDTLLIEVESALFSFRAAASRLHALRPEIGVEDFVETARSCAREAWYALPGFGYASRIGISSWEGLWAEFGDECPGQRLLASDKARYRFDAWNGALLAHGVSDAGLANELASIFAETRRNRHLLFPDSLAFLEALARSGHGVALATNGSPDMQRCKIERSGLGDRFEAIFISGEIGFRKPEREFFGHCLSRLGWRPGETAMVGDTLESDIRGARDSGIASIWLNRSGKPKAAGIEPDFTVSSLTEILGIIA